MLKLRRNLKEVGVAGTFKRLLSTLRDGYVHETMIAMVKDLSPSKAGEVGLRLEVLTKDGLPAVSEFNRRRGEPEADGSYVAGLKKGYVCLLGFKGEELVGLCHVVLGGTGIEHHDFWMMGPRFELGPDDSYGSGLFVLAERRGGVGTEFMQRMETWLYRQGMRHFLFCVEQTNGRAVHLYEKLGYRVTSRIRYWALGPLRFRKVMPAGP